MNRFVNYGKRSIALPAGCKDLVDVLRSRKRRQVLPKLDVSSDQGFCDIPHHLSSFLASSVTPKNLTIFWGLVPNYLLLTKADGVTILAVVREDGGCHSRILEVFREHGASPISDDVVSGALRIRILKYQAPSNLAMLEKLVLALLGFGYQVREEARLEFSTWDDKGVNESPANTDQGDTWCE
jgi:hypothetical protein